MEKMEKMDTSGRDTRLKTPQINRENRENRVSINLAVSPYAQQNGGEYTHKNTANKRVKR
jgi:hypothetical protein